MPVRKPLVYDRANGRSEELPSGDTILGAVDVISLTSAGALAVNDAVFINGIGEVGKAKADSVGTMPCFGFALNSTVGQGESVDVQISGKVSGLTGLTAGDKHYVSTSTAGSTQATGPTASGQVSQIVGIAISTTQILLDIRNAVVLS